MSCPCSWGIFGVHNHNQRLNSRFAIFGWGREECDGLASTRGYATDDHPPRRGGRVIPLRSGIIGHVMCRGVNYLFTKMTVVWLTRNMQIQRGSNLAVWLGSLSLLACSAAWMTAAMYSRTWTSSDSTASDIWAWSCAHQDTDLNYGNESVSFGTLCQYMVSSSLSIRVQHRSLRI